MKKNDENNLDVVRYQKGVKTSKNTRDEKQVVQPSNEPSRIQKPERKKRRPKSEPTPSSIDSPSSVSHEETREFTFDKNAVLASEDPVVVAGG